MVTVISDGTWQKRYDCTSLAGFVGVYGALHRRVPLRRQQDGLARSMLLLQEEGRARPQRNRYDCAARTWDEAPDLSNLVKNVNKNASTRSIYLAH